MHFSVILFGSFKFMITFAKQLLCHVDKKNYKDKSYDEGNNRKELS